MSWDGGKRVLLSNFERGSDSWVGHGTTPPVLGSLPRLPASPRSLHFLTDHFDGPLDAELWPVQVGDVEVSGGALFISDQSTAIPFSYVDSRGGYTLSGSTVQAKISIPVVFWEGLDLRWEIREATGTDSLAFVWVDTNATLIMRQTVDAVDTDQTVDYDPVAMAYLRITEADGMVSWDTSPDGLVWTTRATAARLVNVSDVYLRFRALDAASFTSSAIPGSMLPGSSPPGSIGASPAVIEGGVLVVEDLNSTVVDPHTDEHALSLRWREYLPFTFDDADLGFDDGEFRSTGGFTDPDARFLANDLIIGETYIYTAWVYAATGSPALRLGVAGMSETDPTAVWDEWVELTYEFTATATSHTIRVIPDSAPVGESMAFVDGVMLPIPGEDVTLRTLGRTSISFRYGRDTIRSLADVAPGDTPLELNNRSRDYSPDNPDSPLVAYLGPGKPVYVSATFEGRQYSLFNGFIDQYKLVPDISNRSVKLTAQDLLGTLASINLSTGVYTGLRTGGAINQVLDEVGWPENLRDIDVGATGVPYWWEEGTDALTAINKLMQAEGTPAIAYVEPTGVFVFRDRHHRLIRSKSLEVQTVFTDGEDGRPEPIFSTPVDFDLGYRDLINDITYSVEETRPKPDHEVVFSSGRPISVRPGELLVLGATGDSPFIDARPPVEGVDYTVLSGTVDISLERTSGQATRIHIQDGGTGAVLSGLQLRAIPLETNTNIQLRFQDAESIAKHGLKSLQGSAVKIPWANYNDVSTMALTLLGQRARRLPVMSITVNHGQRDRMYAILNTRISDKVRIQENETFSDHEYYVEYISHTVGDGAKSHVAEIGCERASAQLEQVFTFDVSDQGFDQGLFGIDGISDPNRLFIFDRSKFDEGLFGF
ncbi:hypothetical protein [Streptomyces sp. NPDC057686]|uniref:hypothetical protein n=1 Tax=Streptomyces sp. NPDC057686 TaxID=3346212 RepID=UPI00367B77C0